MTEAVQPETKETESTEGLMSGQNVLDLFKEVGVDLVDMEVAEKVAQEVNKAAESVAEPGELPDSRQLILDKLSSLVGQNEPAEAIQK